MRTRYGQIIDNPIFVAMFKNIFEAITNSVDAFQYWGIGAAMLVLLLYLAKTYFSINPPKEINLIQKPEIKEVIFGDIHKWFKSKKEMPQYNTICLVTFGKNQKCLIVFHKDELSISIFYRINSYAINSNFNFIITISNNSADLSKEVKSIYYKELYKTSLVIINNKRKLNHTLNSSNYQNEITRLFNVEKVKSLVEYDFFWFLENHQIL